MRLTSVLEQRIRVTSYGGEFDPEIHPWHLLAISGRCWDHGYEGKDILEKEAVFLPRGGLWGALEMSFNSGCVFGL